MRHVILYSAGPLAQGLPEALSAAHCTATICHLSVESGEVATLCAGDDGAPNETEPLAVLFDLAAEVELTELHAAMGRAALSWPGVPLVACRREEPGTARGGAARFDDAVLRRLGFYAVAADPVQVAAVLRDVEDGGADDGTEPQAARPELASATLLAAAPITPPLPERLSRARLRSAFDVVAALHLAADQKSAAQAALAGLAALIRADCWSVHLVGGGAAGRETLFEPLAALGRTSAGAPSAATREALRAAATVRRRESDRKALAAPLFAGERVAGVIEATRTGRGARPFSATEAALLSALALPLSAALSNSARVAEAERLSQTDDLTRLHNARYLRQYLTSELKRARRYGSEVTAIFLDLDDFKQVNDRHGHLVGSHVLMEMGSVILACVRDTDIVCRYGGDEFVVILPEAGIEQGLGVADRVRERVSRHPFTGGRNLRLRLTASFGVASFPEHAQSPQQLIAQADAAMYRAKSGRKNCVRFAAEATADA
jgi:diguanylate cyclase (GGDEF)-like protein